MNGGTSNAIFQKYEKKSVEIKTLRAEASLQHTSELQQVLAQLEVTLTRKENQKLQEKTMKKSI